MVVLVWEVSISAEIRNSWRVFCGIDGVSEVAEGVRLGFELKQGG